MAPGQKYVIVPPPRDSEVPKVTADEENEVMETMIVALLEVTTQNGEPLNVCEKFSVQAVTAPDPTLMPPHASVEPVTSVGPEPQLVSDGAPPEVIAVPSVFEICAHAGETQRSSVRMRLITDIDTI
jgi:hypothetical protein